MMLKKYISVTKISDSQKQFYDSLIKFYDCYKNYDSH